ncbi:MAG: hypothetical protein GF398_11660 [Chitinivibrionales bacterium]|nr:hypothetical protein [Chitinivibrionales bacterium]
MAHLNWQNLVGQDRIKEVLGSAFAAASLGHAYLFCGDAGTGKFQAAVELAAAMLCLNPQNAPCQNCDSCRKVANNAHPDLHIVYPVTLAAELKSTDGKLSEKGWDALAKLTARRIGNPYLQLEYSGNPVIPVELIRELNHAVVRGSIDGIASVAIVDGIDVMKKESANAMLKILEEPPEKTLFILTTERQHAVLPTIVSRSQVVRFGYLPAETIVRRLKELRPEAEDSTLAAAADFAMGSFGRALGLVDNPVEDAARTARLLWELCLMQDWHKIGRTLDSFLPSANYELCRQIFIQMMYFIRTRLFADISDASAEEIRMRRVRGCWQADKLLHICQRAVSALQSNGNMLIVCVNALMEAMEILHGEKQQSR